MTLAVKVALNPKYKQQPIRMGRQELGSCGNKVFIGALLSVICPKMKELPLIVLVDGFLGIRRDGY